MSVLREEEVSEALRKEVEAARNRHDEAQRAFWKVAAETDHGLSAAEYQRRVREADKAYVASQEDLLRALRQFNDFLLHRVIPDDGDGRRGNGGAAR